MMFVTILIILLVLMISYHFLFSKLKEPLTQATSSPNYQPYNNKSPMLMAEQNASNIISLKKTLDGIDLDKVKKEIKDLSGNVAQNTNSIIKLVQQIGNLSNKSAMNTAKATEKDPSKPLPVPSGLE